MHEFKQRSMKLMTREGSMRLDDQNSIHGIGRNSDLIHHVQAASGAHPVPYSMSQCIKLPEHEADHSPQSNTEVKNEGALPPFLHMSS
jgi:hypothetical protein